MTEYKTPDFRPFWIKALPKIDDRGMIVGTQVAMNLATVMLPYDLLGDPCEQSARVELSEYLSK